MPNSVLLVDDDEVLCRALQRVLKSAGMKVWTTTNPRAALEYLRTETAPMAILSDHHMPEMSGLELLAEAANLAPHSARLLTTGSPTQALLAEAINKSHVHFYLEKPVQTPHLLALMARVQERHRRQQVPRPLSVRSAKVSGDELYDATLFLGDALNLHRIKAHS